MAEEGERQRHNHTLVIGSRGLVMKTEEERRKDRKCWGEVVRSSQP